MSGHRRDLFWSIWGSGLVILATLSIWIARHPGPTVWELRLDRWIQSLPIATITPLGNALGYSRVVIVEIALFVALLLLLRRPGGALFLVAAISGWFLNQILKSLVQRPRPSVDFVRVTEHPESWSFASGHTTAATLVSGALALLACHYLPRGGFRHLLVAAALAVSLLVGISRVYVGAHWPTDVGAGWLIAALWLSLLVRIVTYSTFRNGPLDQKLPPSGGKFSSPATK